MTTPPTGHHREARIALTTTAELQHLQANNRQMTTFAESCNNRERNDRKVKSQTLKSPPELHAILRCFLAVVVSSAIRKSLMHICPNDCQMSA